ncbi:MAG: flagellar biosynthesis repressor FlbT [Bdellovibrionales bacterium]
MPLKIRVKPEAKIFAGGAVLKNVGTRPADLLILSDGPVLRDSYMMNPDQKDESDAASVYFLLQVLYCFKGKGQKIDHMVMDTLRSFARLYPALAPRINDIAALLEAGDSFKALKLAQGLLGSPEKPVDSAVPYAALLGADAQVEGEV